MCAIVPRSARSLRLAGGLLRAWRVRVGACARAGCRLTSNRARLLNSNMVLVRDRHHGWLKWQDPQPALGWGRLWAMQISDSSSRECNDVHAATEPLSHGECGAMNALYSSCPACQHRFIPWTAWKISRWSCMACPACHSKLNRRLDGRAFAIFLAFLLAFGALLRAIPAYGLPRTLVLVTGAVIFYFLDVCTVRLLQPTSHTKLGGYKN